MRSSSMNRSTRSFFTIQNKFETVGKVLGRVEILDLEAFHRVSLLVELETEQYPFRRR